MGLVDEAFGSSGTSLVDEALNDAPKPNKKQKAARFARPILEYGGMMLGGLLGTGAEPGGGTVAGAGLGYAAGRRVANAVDVAVGNKTPETAKQAFGGAAKDTVVGAGMEAGGGIAGKVIQKTGQAIAKSGLPEKLYGSAIKTPLSKKWVSTLPGQEISQRTRAINKGIQERVPPSEYGVAKAKAGEKTAREAVNTAVKGETTPISTQEVVDKGLKDAYTRAANSEDPIRAKRIIDSWAQKHVEGHGPTVSPEKAEGIKRELYKDINWNQSWAKSLTETARKGVAHEYMLALEKINPSLRALNQTDAAWINLREAIEKALARNSNRDMIGLGTKVLTGRSWPMAIMDATIGHPQIKAKLAFALNRAGMIGAKKLRMTSYVAGKAMTGD